MTYLGKKRISALSFKIGNNTLPLDSQWANNLLPSLRGKDSLVFVNSVIILPRKNNVVLYWLAMSARSLMPWVPSVSLLISFKILELSGLRALKCLLSLSIVKCEKTLARTIKCSRSGYCSPASGHSSLPTDANNSSAGTNFSGFSNNLLIKNRINRLN